MNEEEIKSKVRISITILTAVMCGWVILNFWSLDLSSPSNCLFYIPFAFFTGNVMINSYNIVSNFDEYFEKMKESYIEREEDEENE